MTKAKPKPVTARPKWLLPGILVAVVVVIAAAALLLTQPQPASGGQPKAVFDQTLLDYGDVSYKTPIEAVFQVSNTGTGPLQILGEPRVELMQGC